MVRPAIRGTTDFTPGLAKIADPAHHALDDAIEQAELLANLLAWCGHRRE
jgi:hypothetical protein